MMRWPWQKKREPRIMDRLIRLARGDIDLVQDAIRYGRCDNPDKPADAQKVVEFIITNRERYAKKSA